MRPATAGGGLRASAKAGRPTPRGKVGKELVALARQQRGSLNGQPQSLREIAAYPAERGCVTSSVRPHSASAISSMLGVGSPDYQEWVDALANLPNLGKVVPGRGCGHFGNETDWHVSWGRAKDSISHITRIQFPF
jgi:hypothetical protein